MRRIAPRVTAEVSDRDIDLVEQQAAQILEQIGLEVPLPAALERCAERGDCQIRRERVHFPAEHTLSLLHSLRGPAIVSPGGQLHVSAGGGALSILDHTTGCFRPPTTKDLLLTLRVCDALGLGGDPPVIPADIPMPLREVALYRLAWENTRAFTGRDLGSVPVAEYVYEMAQAAGKPFSLPLYMISPLRANAENLALILHFAGRLPALRVGTMPMPGATAPLSAPGYVAQALAEAIGGYALLSLLIPQARISFGLTILAFDPYANTIGCGSPEGLLQGQMEVALLARYGQVPSLFFWSMAGGCDAQAAAERMAGVMLGALAGVREFGVAGRLQGEAFSLEQLVIDLEIAAYVERVLQGQLWDDPSPDWLDEIREGVLAGTFLGAPSTAARYRAETLRSPIFSRYTLAQRRDMGEPDLRQRLRQRIESLDAAQPMYLTSDARRELERIYRHAAANLR